MRNQKAQQELQLGLEYARHGVNVEPVVMEHGRGTNPQVVVREQTCGLVVPPVVLRQVFELSFANLPSLVSRVETRKLAHDAADGVVCVRLVLVQI